MEACEYNIAQVEDNLSDTEAALDPYYAAKERGQPITSTSKSATSEEETEDEGVDVDPTLRSSPMGSLPSLPQGDEGEDDLDLDDLAAAKPKASTPRPPTPRRDTIMSPGTDLAGRAQDLHLRDSPAAHQNQEMVNLSNNAGGEQDKGPDAANPDEMDTTETEDHNPVTPAPVPAQQDRPAQDQQPPPTGAGQPSAVQPTGAVPQAAQGGQPQGRDELPMERDSGDDENVSPSDRPLPASEDSEEDSDEGPLFTTVIPRTTCPEDQSSLWYLGPEMNLPLPRITRINTTSDEEMEEKIETLCQTEFMACVRAKAAKDIKKNVDRPVQQTYMPCVLWKPHLRLLRWRDDEFSLRNHWVPQQTAPFPYGHKLTNVSAKVKNWHKHDYFNKKSLEFVCEAWRFGMWYYAQQYPFDVAIQQPVFQMDMRAWFKENVKSYDGDYHALKYWDGSYTLWYKGQLVSFSHMNSDDLAMTHLYPGDAGMHKYSIEAERRMDEWIDNVPTNSIGVYEVGKTSKMPFFGRILKEGPYRWHSIQDRKISIMSFALMAELVQGDIELKTPYVEPGFITNIPKQSRIAKSVACCHIWDDKNFGIACPVKDCKIFNWYDDRMLFYWHWQIIHQGVNGFHRCLAVVPSYQGRTHKFKPGQLEAPKVDHRGRPKAVGPCGYYADTKRSIRTHYTKHLEHFDARQSKKYWEDSPHGGSMGCDAISLADVDMPSGASVRKAYMNPGAAWVWLWNDRTEPQSGTAYPCPTMPEWKVLKLEQNSGVAKPSELWKNIDRMDDSGYNAVRKYNLSRAYAKLLRKETAHEGDEDPDDLMIWRRQWAKGQKKKYERQL